MRQTEGQWYYYRLTYIPTSLEYLNGIFGGFNLSEMREDELEGIFDSIQLGGRQKIVQGKILHQRRVVVHRVQRLLQARVGLKTGMAQGNREGEELR